MARTKKKELPPRPEIEVDSLYLKNIEKKHTDWFRKEAKRLDYKLNEFFELMVKHFKGVK